MRPIDDLPTEQIKERLELHTKIAMEGFALIAASGVEPAPLAIAYHSDGTTAMILMPALNQATTPEERQEVMRDVGQSLRQAKRVSMFVLALLAWTRKGLLTESPEEIKAKYEPVESLIVTAQAWDGRSFMTIVPTGRSGREVGAQFAWGVPVTVAEQVPSGAYLMDAFWK